MLCNDILHICLRSFLCIIIIQQLNRANKNAAYFSARTYTRIIVKHIIRFYAGFSPPLCVRYGEKKKPIFFRIVCANRTALHTADQSARRELRGRALTERKHYRSTVVRFAGSVGNPLHVKLIK